MTSIPCCRLSSPPVLLTFEAAPVDVDRFSVGERLVSLLIQTVKVGKVYIRVDIFVNGSKLILRFGH